LNATRQSTLVRKLGRESWLSTSWGFTVGSSERRNAMMSRRSSSEAFGSFTIQGGV
jgi:hypothetical protein